MDSGIVCRQPIGTDGIYAPAEGSLCQDHAEQYGHDDHDKENVGNDPDFPGDHAEAVRIGQGNGSAASQCDLRDPAEYDLGSQRYDRISLQRLIKRTRKFLRCLILF